MTAMDIQKQTRWLFKRHISTVPKISLHNCDAVEPIIKLYY